MLLGGIGGVFGTLDNCVGPYGAVVGPLVGATATAIPIMHKPRPNNILQTGRIHGSVCRLTDVCDLSVHQSYGT